MHAMANFDEKIDETVGWRQPGDHLPDALGDWARKREMQKAGFLPRFPKAVYRFKTFEEADEWMMKAMTTGRRRD